jgi:hypothetical protein
VYCNPVKVNLLSEQDIASVITVEEKASQETSMKQAC